MNNLIFKRATIENIDFVTEVILNAEMGSTNKLGLSNIFDISKKEVENLLKKMLLEEIDGCEFSISSYIIAFWENEPVAAFGGWIEGYNESIKSSILKVNLLTFTLPNHSLLNLQAKSHLLKEIQIEREIETYQLEYSYVVNDFRGQGITKQLINLHIENVKNTNPNIKKIQVQVFDNNIIAKNVYESSGFKIIKKVESSSDEIFNIFPYNIKVLMEKFIN